MKSKLCSLLIHSPLHDPEFIRNVEEKIKVSLENSVYLGRYSGGQADISDSDCEGYLLTVATGGTEGLMLRLMPAIEHKPTIFIAYDIANSLPAFMEAYPILKQRARNMAYLLADFDDLEKSIAKGEKILSAYFKIRESKLGLIGGVSEWLVYSKTPLSLVREKLGISVAEIPIEEVYARYQQAELKGSEGELNKLLGGSVPQVPLPEVEKAYKLYIALREIVESEKLDGFSIKCFDIIKSLKTTACLAVSLFNSSLITAGCEGDIPSFLSMYVLTALTGKPAFMGNPSKVEGKRLLIAHCTAPIAISKEKPILKTHFESNMGVGIAITFKNGEVTFLRFAPELSEARVFKGRIVSGEPKSEKHCRSQAWVEVPFDARALIDKSIGNHYVFVEGDHVEELMALLSMMGVRAEVLDS